jgi:hypothetical protein
MLPASLPNARILAFNYESKWHENAPHTRLLGVAEQLLLAIHGLRSRVWTPMVEQKHGYTTNQSLTGGKNHQQANYLRGP